MQRHDGFLPLLWFEEAERDLRVHEPVFRQDRCAVGVLQDVERFLEVGITVRVIGPEPVAWKVPLGGFVQAGSQLVGQGVAFATDTLPCPGIVAYTQNRSTKDQQFF